MLKNKGILLIVGFILGVILTGGVSFATFNYYANQVGYTKPNEEEEITVAEALNELYKNKQDVSELNSVRTQLNTLNSSINQTDALPADIISGKYAYTKNNGLIQGTFNKQYDSGSFTIPASGTQSVNSLNFTPSKVIIFNLSTSQTLQQVTILEGNLIKMLAYGFSGDLSALNGYHEWNKTVQPGTEITSNGFNVADWQVGYTHQWIAIK